MLKSSGKKKTNISNISNYYPDQNNLTTIQNELINEESLQYFIQTNFKTRGGTPMKNTRWKTAFYVDEVCSDKHKIMRKLRKINYDEYFGSNFNVAQIDPQFKDLDNQEKVKVIDNVIDFLFQDLKSLKHKKKKEVQSKEEKEVKRANELGLQQKTQFELAIEQDPKRVTNYSPFLADLNYHKLKKKNIHLSPSIVYKRPDTKLQGKYLPKISFVGGNFPVNFTLEEIVQEPLKRMKQEQRVLCADIQNFTSYKSQYNILEIDFNFLKLLLQYIYRVNKDSINIIIQLQYLKIK